MNWLRVACKIFGSIFFLATLAQAQSPWQLSARLQSGVEYDSNIYESTARTVSTAVGRLLMQTRATYADPRWRITLDYSAAMLAYESARDENKVLQEGNASLMWLAKNGMRFYVRGQGNLKLYLENPTDYGTTSGSFGTILPPIKNLSCEIGAETGQLDYARGDDFDFTFSGAFLALRRQFGAQISSEAMMLYRRLDYVRPSFANTPSYLEADTQKDDFAALRLAASYSRRILLQGRLEIQRNRSTRSVFDYNRLQVHMLVGYPFAPRWLLRASLLFQRKSYLAAAPPISLPELDPEREQSNNVVFDLSRELSQTTALLLRFSYHNNESPVRSLFYRKTLLFAGVELHL